MTGFRTFCIGTLLLVAATGLISCSGGETIPVEPVRSSLDGNPDANFRALAPMCGDRLQRGVAMLPDGRAWIVGDRGLILAFAEGRWQSQVCPAPGDLLTVLAGPRGNLVAAGTRGLLIEWNGDRWQNVDTGLATTLREVYVGPDVAWAVGDEGVALRRDRSGWQRIPVPEMLDLTGVTVLGAQTFICSAQGALWSWDGSVWTDESQGPWGETPPHTLTVLQAGPVVAATRDRVYFRQDGVWLPRPEISFWETFDRLRSAGSELLIESQRYVGRYRETINDHWIRRTSWTSGNHAICATTPGNRWLVASDEGEIIWSGADFDDHDARPDAVSLDPTARLFRLEDGTCGAFGNSGLRCLDESGLVAVEGLSEDLLALLPGTSQVVGFSLDDFYFHRLGRLYHLEDRELTGPFDVGVYSSNYGAVLDREGVLHIAGHNGVFRWTGSDTVRVVGDATSGPYRLRRLRSGDLVAWSGSEVQWQHDGEWVEIPLPPGRSFYGETEAGDLCAYDAGDYYAPDVIRIWRHGMPEAVSVRVELVPGYEDFRVSSVASGPGGIYVATDTPSRVYRLGGDGLSGRWEPVTGLYPGRFSQLRVLDDGSLLAIDVAESHILWHRTRAAP